MKLAAELSLWLLAALGHLSLWVTFVNRINGFGKYQRLMHVLNRALLLPCVLIPALVLGWHLWLDRWIYQSLSVGKWPNFMMPYIALCWVMACWTLLDALYRLFLRRPPKELIAHQTSVVDLAKLAGHTMAVSPTAQRLAGLPGNQIFELHIETVELTLARLPKQLDGLSIVHLTDFHMAGHISRPFHEAVVEQANALDGDLVLITGDILDRNACYDWLPHTIGKLKARHGGYFILGNHEHHLSNPVDARRRIEGLGLTNLGSTYWATKIGDTKVTLAGNELPWFGEAPSLPAKSGDELRILLSHAPDQIAWASRQGFDLMLAGHTHGGQFCLPRLGPVVCPSRYGVKYAAGLFRRGGTMLYVSRGISGMAPLRLNCPPEITKLILRSM